MTPSEKKWQQIIWREWRASSDPEYTRHLFELVAEQRVGLGGIIPIVVLNTVAGAAVAVLLALVVTPTWDAMQHLLWTGAILGGIRGVIKGRGLIWADWLERLSANTPVGSTSRLVAGVLGLALIGGMIFGPLFWLVGIGFFWIFGDIIYWINRGLTSTAKRKTDDRHWWFWWRPRPHLFEVERALQVACRQSPEARDRWKTPLALLAARSPQVTSPEVFIKMLYSADWKDRFVGRHSLVRQGDGAVHVLQQLVHQETPLKTVALRLLRDIKRGSSVPQPSPSDIFSP